MRYSEYCLNTLIDYVEKGFIEISQKGNVKIFINHMHPKLQSDYSHFRMWISKDIRMFFGKKRQDVAVFHKDDKFVTYTANDVYSVMQSRKK